MDRKVETVRLKLLQPCENGGAFKAELGNEVDANPNPSSPITLGRERHHRLLGVDLRMALRMARETDRADSMALDRAAQADVRTGLKGPNARKVSPAITRTRFASASPRARAEKSSSASRDRTSRAAICGIGLI